MRINGHHHRIDKDPHIDAQLNALQAECERTAAGIPSPPPARPPEPILHGTIGTVLGIVTGVVVVFAAMFFAGVVP